MDNLELLKVLGSFKREDFDELNQKYDDLLNAQPQNKKGGLRKICDFPKACSHPEHNPPSHIVLEPGLYEYVCPGCGNAQIFTVPAITF